jgi:hypothetical protein
VKLSTCAVDGATIRYVVPEDGAAYWEHVDSRLDGHRPDPDDGYVSGPDRDDLPPCTGCHHPEHEEGGCEERVSTGRYGSDGVLVYDWCSCTGPVPPAPREESYADPWLDPDAAARAVPPPF